MTLPRNRILEGDALEVLRPTENKHPAVRISPRLRLGKDEWLTPPDILTALGPFDLDPCAPINRPWDMATRHFTVRDDGLSQPWSGRVWLNPPFGSETGKWTNRLDRHGNGIALVPASTDAKWFHQTVWGGASVRGLLFLKGRLSFFHANGSQAKNNNGKAIVLVAYGVDNLERLKTCGLPGVVVPWAC
jgi:hypothetical protein